MEHGYREHRQHGTHQFPCAYYNAKTDIKKDGKFEVKYHWHEEVEFMLLQRGRFRMEINMVQYELEGPRPDQAVPAGRGRDQARGPDQRQNPQREAPEIPPASRIPPEGPRKDPGLPQKEARISKGSRRPAGAFFDCQRIPKTRKAPWLSPWESCHASA